MKSLADKQNAIAFTTKDTALKELIMDTFQEKGE